MKKISIVTPLFNEEQNVLELHSRVSAAMHGLPYEYEHICIDNNSSDNTLLLLRELAHLDKNLKVIVNARNFGYNRSSFHGLMQASGDAVVLIASDLQDPPEIIPEFIEKWEMGFKSVLATKSGSEESAMMFAVRKLYYSIIGRISEVPLVPNATGSGLFDRVVIGILRDLKDPYPYFRGLISEIGFPVGTVSFKQPRRARGITSQNFYSLYDMAALGMTKHSKVPLRMMIFLGFILAGCSMLIALFYFIKKLIFWDSFEMGLAPILIGMFFLNAIQMLFLGLLGEYIGTIQTHIRNLPHVIESERINF